MRVLFLDDEEWRAKEYRRKRPGDEMVWEMDPEDFVKTARSSRFDVLSLDHDLGHGYVKDSLRRHFR